MCLIIDETVHRKVHGQLQPKTARTPIRVYKRLRRVSVFDILYSPIRAHVWQLGVGQSAELGIDKSIWPDDGTTVHEGLHAYAKLAAAKKHLMADDQLFIAVIPKGTKYFLGTRGDIAAARMTVIRRSRRKIGA